MTRSEKARAVLDAGRRASLKTQGSMLSFVHEFGKTPEEQSIMALRLGKIVGDAIAEFVREINRMGRQQ